MANYTVNNGTVTFNLPDEGTVFRAVGDDHRGVVYKVVGGKLQTVSTQQYIANADANIDGVRYAAGSVIPRPLNYADLASPQSVYGAYNSTIQDREMYERTTGAGSWAKLPTYNMGDIQTVLQRNGGVLPTTPKAEAYDPAIQGIIDNGNPNKVDPVTGMWKPDPNAPAQNNAVVTGTIDPKTGTVAAPTMSLQPGATGTDVKQLQAFLSVTINPKTGQPYLTDEQIKTGPGIYGPATTAAVKAFQENNGVDNSTGVGYWGPRTIAAVKTGGSSLSPSAPSQTNIGDPADVSTASAGSILPSSSLNLPQANGTQAVANYTQSLTGQLETLKKALTEEAAKRAADYDKKIKELEVREKELQALQDEGMADYGDAVVRETAEKRAAFDLEKQRFDLNYNANQALIGELSDLLTQGNTLIQQMQETTGLASIMQPRISKTMTDVAARAGVIEAVMNARNGQMANAQNQLQTSLSAISSIYQDEIDYYKSVVNYYGSLKGEVKDSIGDLTKDQKEYLDVKLNLLSNDLAQVQQTTKMVSEAMLDPDTAQAYAMAGVTLKDSVETINQKLATHAYSQEIVNINNKMTTSGYGRTPIAGVQPVQIADSQGKLTNWYKAEAREDGSFTLGTNQVRFDAQGKVVASGPKSTETSNPSSNPSKLSATDRQILLGANFTSSDIPTIERDVQQYGINKVLEGISDTTQKNALRKVYGAAAKLTKDEVSASVTQKIAQEGLKGAYTQSELEKLARDNGYAGFLGFGANVDGFLNSEKAKTVYANKLYEQYKAAGMAQ